MSTIDDNSTITVILGQEYTFNRDSVNADLDVLYPNPGFARADITNDMLSVDAPTSGVNALIARYFGEDHGNDLLLGGNINATSALADPRPNWSAIGTIQAPEPLTILGGEWIESITFQPGYACGFLSQVAQTVDAQAGHASHGSIEQLTLIVG